MKIGVLFNCQSAGLAACLRNLLPGHEVVQYRFGEVAQSDENAEEAAVALRRCDTVITTLTGAKLRGADPAALAAGGVRIVRIPHVVFGGFHPDSCYSPDPALRIPGPTERFHSRIAACGYLAGLAIEDTLALYGALAFARLGYFDYYGLQHAAMMEQWAAHGVDLTPWFARWAAQGCFMHSMNHPKIRVLFDVARILCDTLELTACDTAEMPCDDMLTYASHPVLPDLAARLGVAAETTFRPPSVAARPPVPMDLPTFLSRSFAAFAKVPVEAVRALDGVPGGMRALALKEAVLF